MYVYVCMYELPVVPVYAYVFLNVRIGIGRDLLDENHVKNNLTVREDKIKGIYIAGVTEEYVTSVEELLGIMSVGRSGLHSFSSCILTVMVSFLQGLPTERWRPQVRKTKRWCSSIYCALIYVCMYVGMNEGSSRSHSVFTITVSQKDVITNATK